MKIIGNGLSKLHEKEDLDFFTSMYKMTPWQMIVEDEVFKTTQLWGSDYKYVVFMDPAGTLKMAFELEGQDHLHFYASPRCNGYVCTSGIAFMRAYQKESYDYKEMGFYALENSPYDLLWEDDQFPYIVGENFEAICQELRNGFGLNKSVAFTKSNTYFISCL